MREEPPAQLVGLLQRSGLATEAQVRQMGRRVRWLAGDLPRFESVWVDALAQARILTPFQAAEINARRGELLRIGPYVLCERLGWPYYAACYRARRVGSGETVRLVEMDGAAEPADEVLRRLERLAAASEKLTSAYLAPVADVGADGGRIWAAGRWIQGRTAAQWMVHNGRFPPELVLEIARAMLGGLVCLERTGLCHGDISTAGLMLAETGHAVLLQPGLRGILRPEEGHAHADLPPAAYDCLAPERIADGTPPDTGSDVYACGCLWWHLLCGRPAVGGGDSLAKLRAGQSAEVFDVRRLAPETPAPLASTIAACVNLKPSRRPESMARLAATLGPPTERGRLALARRLARCGHPAARGAVRSRGTGPSSGAPLRWAAIAGCLVAALAILWLVWHARQPMPTATRRSADETADGADRTGVPAAAAGAERVPSADPSAVELASYLDSRGAPQTAAAEQSPPAAPGDLVLDSGGPLELESLPLRPGQRVRGMPGERPLVMVPPTGLVIGAEDICFEGVDFVYGHAAAIRSALGRPAAMVNLCAARAEFRRCSFQSTRRASVRPDAIRWTHPADRTGAVLSLPSGRVQLRDCVLGRVNAGVDCRTVGALAVELTNTLHVGAGPLVRLDHCPGSDESILMCLAQVTLRGAGPLLECRYQRVEDGPGEISIRASRCAFVPRPGAALLLLSGPKSPQRMLGNIRWTGQGSLVSPQAAITAWQTPDGGQQVLDDSSVSMDGLVRSKVEFVGGPEGGPPASRIDRWQAPLQSTGPPGIDAASLPLPAAGGPTEKFDNAVR